MEQDFVDIIVRAGHREILFEVKSHPDAKAAIRESLGQLLEYAYFSPERLTKDPELIIIAPAPITAAVAKYLDGLRLRFNLKLRYIQYSLGGPFDAV